MNASIICLSAVSQAAISGFSLSDASRRLLLMRESTCLKHRACFMLKWTVSKGPWILLKQPSFAGFYCDILYRLEREDTQEHLILEKKNPLSPRVPKLYCFAGPQSVLAFATQVEALGSWFESCALLKSNMKLSQYWSPPDLKQWNMFVTFEKLSQINEHFLLHNRIHRMTDVHSFKSYAMNGKHHVMYHLMLLPRHDSDTQVLSRASQRGKPICVQNTTIQTSETPWA